MDSLKGPPTRGPSKSITVFPPMYTRPLRPISQCTILVLLRSQSSCPPQVPPQVTTILQPIELSRSISPSLRYQTLVSAKSGHALFPTVARATRARQANHACAVAQNVPVLCHAGKFGQPARMKPIGGRLETKEGGYRGLNRGWRGPHQRLIPVLHGPHQCATHSRPPPIGARRPPSRAWRCRASATRASKRAEMVTAQLE